MSDESVSALVGRVTTELGLSSEQTFPNLEKAAIQYSKQLQGKWQLNTASFVASPSPYLFSALILPLTDLRLSLASLRSPFQIFPPNFDFFFPPFFFVSSH